MYYCIYKIKNIINQKIYIGAHKTKNINDDYMGSGKLLKTAIIKYGIENFTKEILFIFDNIDDMYSKEKELVNEKFVSSKNTYNIKLGGIGGWDHLSSEELYESRSKGGKASIEKLKNHKNYKKSQFKKNSTKTKELSIKANIIKAAKLQKNPEIYNDMKEKQSKKMLENNIMKGKVWCYNIITGKRYPFQINEIPDGWCTSSFYKESKKNKKSPQYGKSWYNNGIENIFCHPDNIPENFVKGRLFSFTKQKR